MLENLPTSTTLSEFLDMDEIRARLEDGNISFEGILYENSRDIAFWCKMAELVELKNHRSIESVEQVQTLRNELLTVKNLTTFDFKELWRVAASALRTLGATESEISEHLNPTLWSLECQSFGETSTIKGDFRKVPLLPECVSYHRCAGFC